MKNNLVVVLTIFLAGCASQSTRAYFDLDKDHPDYLTQECQKAIEDTNVHDDLKLVRTIVSPVVLFFTGGAALPIVVAGNAGLDYADRSDASAMNSWCGGRVSTDEEIAQGVAEGVALSVVTSAIPTPTLPQAATTTTK